MKILIIEWVSAEGGTWWSYLIAFIVFLIFFPIIILHGARQRRKEDEAYCLRKGITYEKLLEIRSNRRARRIPPSVKKYIFERDNHQCQYCGAVDNLAIDHIFPFSRGGGNEHENLQILCQPCNSRKGASVPREFTIN